MFLEQINEKRHLYSGLLHKFELNSRGELDLILIKKASKYVTFEKNEDNEKLIENIIKNLGDKKMTIHGDYKDKIVFKKRIPGELLALKYSNVINFNLTYIKVLEVKDRVIKILNEINNGVLYLSLIIFILFPFFNFGIIDELYNKIIFSILSFLNTFLIVGFFSRLINWKKDDKIGESLLFTVFSISIVSIYYLKIFLKLDFLWLILIFILTFSLMAISLPPNKQENDNNAT